MPAGHVPQPVLLKKLADTKCLSLHAIRYAEYASPHMPRIRSLRHACSIRVDIFYPRNKNFHIQCIQRTRVTSRYQRNRRALERKEILCRGFSTRSRIHSRNHGKNRREKLENDKIYLPRQSTLFRDFCLLNGCCTCHFPPDQTEDRQTNVWSFK